MRSRVTNTRGASPEQAAPRAQAPAAHAAHAANDRSAPAGPAPVDHDQQVNGGARPAATAATAAAKTPRSPGRRSLKNWRVRSRLLLLVAIPTLTAVALGGIRIYSAEQSASTYQRVVQLAGLSRQITGLVQALQDQREDTIKFIVLGTNGGRAAALAPNAKDVLAAPAPEQSLLAHDYAYTEQLGAQVKNQAAAVGGGFPLQARQEAADVSTAIAGIPALYSASIHSQLPALVVIQEFANTISQLLALDDQVAVGSNDTQLAGAVRVLGLVSRMKEDVSEQQAILSSGLGNDLISKGNFGSSQLSAITAAQADQQSSLSDFNIAASGTQRQLFDGALSGAVVGLAQAQEQQAIALASNNSALAADPIIADASAAASYTIGSMRSVEQQLVSQIFGRSTSLRNGAITAAVIGGAAVLLVLVLALLFTTVVGRSMIRPLQRLRTGALEVAGVGLPKEVRRLSESEDVSTDGIEVAPIDVDSTDEIGEVARAFDQVHKEALQLAANEAALRGNVNAMFVNLSRRSQSLVERQIRLIDDLEQGEQDAERLANLFQMDHLATRMRRNSENLLVLAGHDLSKRWNQPVALVDVLRAAVSEIEEYERVSLNVQPGIAVRGQAVNDVVHLLAELAENATSLSSADTPVNVSGHLLTSGGVLLDITDQGVGMGAEEMAHANWRLDNPPVVDVAVSRRMGLFVVGRLAARHGIRVRLRPATSGGLTALVWLPDEVITQSSPTQGPTGFDTAESGAGDLDAELAGLGGAEWADSERSAAEQEVSAARTPKFASLRADTEESALGPRRVPGAALRPGASWSTTGPLSVFEPGAQRDGGTQEQPSGVGPQPAGTGNGAATGGQEPMLDGEQPGQEELSGEPAASTGPQPVDGLGGQPFGTVPRPAAGGGGEPFGTVPRPAAGGGGEPFGTVPRPAADGDGEAFGTVPRPAAGGGGGGEPFGSVPPSDAGGSGEAFGAGVQPAVSSPLNGENEAPELAGTPMSTPASYRWDTTLTNGEVIVPPAESLADENRLPIFEAVESDWFRHGRNALGWSAGTEQPEGNWATPADEGWRAAETVPTPSSAGVTPAGLPKRVPQANLVPGSAASTLPQAPTRSAAATRERFASFQRGVREARAAASGEANPDGEDETS